MLLYRHRKKKRLTASEWQQAVSQFAVILAASVSRLSPDHRPLITTFLDSCSIRPGTMMRHQVAASIKVALTTHPPIKTLLENVMYAFIAGLGDDEHAWDQLCYNLSQAFEVNGPNPEMSVLEPGDLLWSPETVLADVADHQLGGEHLDAQMVSARDVMHALLINNRHLVFVAMLMVCQITTPAE